MRIAILLGAAFLALCSEWYVIGRLTLGRRAVRMRTMEGPRRLDGASASADLRIGAFNIAHGRGLAKGNWGAETGPRGWPGSERSPAGSRIPAWTWWC